MTTDFIKDMLDRAQAAQKEINDMGFGPPDTQPSEEQSSVDDYWNTPISEIKIRVDKRDPRLLRVFVDGKLWDRITIRKYPFPERYRIDGDPEYQYDWVSEPHMSEPGCIGPNSTLCNWDQDSWGSALAQYLRDDYFGDVMPLLDRMNPELRDIDVPLVEREESE